ncbi:Transcriptional regulatory protein, C terminal [Roseivivax halotolerans]|uniref:Transcriptional regulatory protein, C terminal n=1 Tax=Roseivivax halotolerans TaxID=93684 RepID=A0A1I5ZTQ9_9RHOB|nr:Transcriptional regulatory protein, C terminal [Roseivivax halotolerans]
MLAEFDTGSARREENSQNGHEIREEFTQALGGASRKAPDLLAFVGHGKGNRVTVKIRLIGDFRVLDDAGSDVTPNAARARALLAILARSPDCTRSRRWIEQTLWPDRSPEQASGSLRQVVSQIRKAFGPLAEDHLVSTRAAISLVDCTTDIEVDPRSCLDRLRSGGDLLEDVRLKVPAYKSWHREEKSRILQTLERTAGALTLGAGAPPLMGRPLSIEVKGFGESARETGQFIGDMLSQQMAGLISDFGTFDTLVDRSAEAKAGGLTLAIRALTVGEEVQILAGLTAQDSGKMVWSETARLDARAGDLLGQGDVPSLVYHSAERVLTQMLDAREDAGLSLRIDALVNAAIAAMFTYMPGELRRAEALLAEAYALRPLSRIAAWRSLLRQIMLVERTEQNLEELHEEARAFAHAALEGNDGNTLVMSLVAQLLAILENDTVVSAVLARDAVEASRFNAFAHSAAATVALRAGDTAAALAASEHAARLAGRAASAHWFDTIAGLSAISAGDLDQAVRHYERAHARAPHFRAPMRHLLCLYAAQGEAQKSAQMARALKRIEPDFDVLRIREDETYPVFTLRQSNLLPSHEMALDLL